MTSKKKERGVALLFFAFSLSLLVMSYPLHTKGVATIGPGFMPTVIGGLLMFLSIVLFVVNSTRVGKVVGQTEEENKENKENKASIDLFRTIETMILLIAYVVLLDVLGFTLITFIYLFLQFMIFADTMSARVVIRNLVLSVASTAAIVFVFGGLLNLFLPKGFW